MDTAPSFVSPSLLLTVYLLFFSDPFIVPVSSTPCLVSLSLSFMLETSLQCLEKEVVDIDWRLYIQVVFGAVYSPWRSVWGTCEVLGTGLGEALTPTSAAPTLPSARVPHTPFLQRRSSGIFCGRTWPPASWDSEDNVRGLSFLERLTKAPTLGLSRHLWFLISLGAKPVSGSWRWTLSLAIMSTLAAVSSC